MNIHVAAFELHRQALSRHPRPNAVEQIDIHLSEDRRYGCISVYVDSGECFYADFKLPYELRGLPFDPDTWRALVLQSFCGTVH
jgi:hypothetical protein